MSRMRDHQWASSTRRTLLSYPNAKQQQQQLQQQQQQQQPKGESTNPTPRQPAGRIPHGVSARNAMAWRGVAWRGVKSAAHDMPPFPFPPQLFAGGTSPVRSDLLGPPRPALPCPLVPTPPHLTLTLLAPCRRVAYCLPNTIRLGVQLPVDHRRVPHASCLLGGLNRPVGLEFSSIQTYFMASESLKKHSVRKGSGGILLF